MFSDDVVFFIIRYILFQQDVDGHVVDLRRSAALDEPFAQGHHRAVALRLGTLGDERRHHARGETSPRCGGSRRSPPAARHRAAAQIARKDVTRRIEGHGPGNRRIFAEHLIQHAAVAGFVVQPQRGVVQPAPEGMRFEVTAGIPPRGCATGSKPASPR